MNKLGCRLCGVKARRLCVNWMYKVAITAILLVLLLVLGYVMQVYKSITVGSLFYFTVMLNAGWFFYLLAPIVRIRLFNALLFMGLFVWGCMLYFCSPVKEGDYKQSLAERQIEAPNRTAAAFFPSRGGFEAIAKFNDRQLRIHYFVFHTAVLFYVALLMFAIFGRGLVNRVRKWLTPWRMLNVFWGRSDAGLLLARNITETTVRGQVFFMLQQRSGDGDEWLTLTHDIDRMDGMWSFTYDSNAVETDVSKDKLSQAKGRRHFFMDELGHVNVSMADRIVKVLRDNRPTPGIKGFWEAFRAGMVVRWWQDCYVRTWTECRQWWKANPSKSFRKMKDILGWCKCCKDQLGKCKWDKPSLYVRIEAPSDELTYQTWAANVREFVTPVLVRESQLTAKDFIKSYPLLKIPRVAEKIDTTTALVDVEKINILLIGFGSTGQDILNEIICNGQFVRSYKNRKSVPVQLHIDVVEQDEKVIEEYCIRHPLATRHPKFSAIEPDVQEDMRYDVEFVDDKDDKDKTDAKGEKRISAVECGDKRYEVDLGTKSIRVEDKTFDDWFRKKLDGAGKKCPYDRIIVCLKGDDKTLGIARKIMEFSRRQGVEIGPNIVFARVKDPPRNRYLPQGEIYSIFSRKTEVQDAGITLFGDLNKIYSFARIDAETVDTMAKVLNSRYNKSEDGHGFSRDLKDKAMRELEWDDASFFDQLSSRAAAEGQRNLLLLRGLDYRANVKGATDDEVIPPEVVDAPLKDDTFNKESVLRTLSINEHLRWNAFHIMMGFRPWHVIGREGVARNDIPEQLPKKKRANQLATIGKHANIIAFEKLPEVDVVLKAWKEGKTKEELGLERKNFEGLIEGASQAWDIAFCQIIGKVAKEAGQEIVKPKSRDKT